jgi:hypothetical protein
MEEMRKICTYLLYKFNHFGDLDAEREIILKCVGSFM